MSYTPQYLDYIPLLKCPVGLKQIRETYLSTIEFYKSQYPESIYGLQYEELVESPEAVLKAVFAFLGIDWEDSVLKFNKLENVVKTASLSQVRQGIMKNTSDDWQNYESFIMPFFEKHNIN